MSGMEIQPLLNFIKEYSHLSKEEFLKTFSFPVLILPGDQETQLPQTNLKDLGEGRKLASMPLATMRMSIDSLEDALPPSFRKVVVDKAKVIFLFFKEKEPGNKTLTIGRTDENDLCFEDTEVSNHHASLVGRGNPPLYFLIDHGSTNGTYVNGVAVPPNKEVYLKDQASIEFGLNRLFVFYLPETFYRCVNLA